MKRAIVAVAGIVLLTSSSARAHHGYSDFFADRTITVDGTLDRVVFANPHVILTVHGKDNHTYTAEWRAGTALNRTGVTNTTLKIGDHVVIVGRPHRDPSTYLVAQLMEVRRPIDGWVWQISQGVR